MNVTNPLTYWQKQQANIHGMMLNPEAEELHHHEKKQIISYLPNLSGKTVLELGAGIGRFTTDFADQAKSVTAVDFNQSFIDENRKRNANYSNINYQCENAIKLSFDKETFDFVFINWLLMYLEDHDAKKVIENIYQWLKPEGQLFLRESCLTDSKGNPPLKPTSSDAQHNHFYSHYRDPKFYLDLLGMKLQLISQGNIEIYEKKYNNPNQLFWLFQKNR